MVLQGVLLHVVVSYIHQCRAIYELKCRVLKTDDSQCVGDVCLSLQHCNGVKSYVVINNICLLLQDDVDSTVGHGPRERLIV